MSQQTRPKATRMTVCDLCDTEIDDYEPGEAGSLTHGFIAHPVEVGDRPPGLGKTLHAWLHWPPAGRDRHSYEKKRRNLENYRQRRYDFHADCILRVVEDAIAAQRGRGRVHNHPPHRPSCAERDVDGRLRGACLDDDGTDR